eukprot:1157258-Pelagomonas_calceolata.AAC.7
MPQSTSARTSTGSRCAEADQARLLKVQLLIAQEKRRSLEIWPQPSRVRLGREALRIDAIQGTVLAEREDLRVQSVTGTKPAVLSMLSASFGSSWHVTPPKRFHGALPAIAKGRSVKMRRRRLFCEGDSRAMGICAGTRGTRQSAARVVML